MEIAVSPVLTLHCSCLTSVESSKQLGSALLLGIPCALPTKHKSTSNEAPLSHYTQSPPQCSLGKRQTTNLTPTNKINKSRVREDEETLYPACPRAPVTSQDNRVKTPLPPRPSPAVLLGFLSRKFRLAAHRPSTSPPAALPPALTRTRSL